MTDLDKAIIEVLKIICRSAQVDSANIFQNFYDTATSKAIFNHRFRWCIGCKQAQFNMEQMQNLQYESSEEAKKWYSVLSSGKVFCSLVSELNGRERRILEKQGIISLILVPILIDDKFWGFLSLENCHSVRLWSESEKSLLITLAAGIGGALARRQSEEALWEEKERLAVTLAVMHIRNGNKEKALNRLSDVEKASCQAKDLTMQLLTFSKDTPPSVKMFLQGICLRILSILH